MKIIDITNQIFKGKQFCLQKGIIFIFVCHLPAFQPAPRKFIFFSFNIYPLSVEINIYKKQKQSSIILVSEKYKGKRGCIFVDKYQCYDNTAYLFT